jgi:hypothetical protein
MNLGPRKIVISIAAIPAIRISPRSTAADATVARGGLIGPAYRGVPGARR